MSSFGVTAGKWLGAAISRIERLGSAIEAQINRIAVRANRFDLAAILAIVILIGLGAYSFFVGGFDLSRFVTGDALYPVQVQLFPILEFRPPPSNNFFPDVMVHMAIGPFIADPLWQKMVAGWVLFTGMLVALYMAKGPLTAFAVVGVLALSGFGFLDSTSHYTLPFCVLAYQLVRHRFLNAIILFLIVFSDLLMLLPLSILLIQEDERDRLLERFLIIGLAVAGNAFYGEFSESFMQIAVLAPVFFVVAFVARTLGFLRLMAIAMAVGLPIMVMMGAAEERYALAVAAAMIVVLAPNIRGSFPWLPAGFVAASLAIFTFSADAERYDLHEAQYDCLLNTLDQRGIANLAVDHWVAKPLYFAARAKKQDLMITQVDFRDNDSSNWMAPLSFAGTPTPIAVKSNTICGYIEEPNAFCTRDKVAKITSNEPICNGLELITYAQPVPIHYQPQPENKLASVIANLSAYLGKVGF